MTNIVVYNCFAMIEAKTLTLYGMISLINHSSEKHNCKSQGIPQTKNFEGVQVYVSTRDIKKGEEILINYAGTNVGDNEKVERLHEIKS